MTNGLRLNVLKTARVAVAPLCLLGFLSVAQTASATTVVSVNGSTTTVKEDSNLDTLDHHDVYMWRISGLAAVPTGQVITGATLSFNGLANWTDVGTDPGNTLFLHLFDTAQSYAADTSFVDRLSANVTRTGDVSSSQTPVTDVVDAFDHSSNYSTYVSALLYNFGSSMSSSELTTVNGIKNTFLAAPQGFGTSPVNYSYSFNQSQLTDLLAYIGTGGDIAIGIDPDCHYTLTDVVLTFTTGGKPVQTSAVPEPASLTLLGIGLAGLYVRRRARKA